MKREFLKTGTARIEYFSDAVLAIIMTLMVLEIHLPEIRNGSSTGEVLRDLKPVLPNIFAFMISFATLGVYWVNHHQFYNAVERSDWKLLWYNLHFLFWCSLVPLSTSLLAEHYQNPAITALYGLNSLASGGAFAIMHVHAVEKGLFLETVSSNLLRRIKRINILSTILVLISIFAGYISVYISIAIFAFLPAMYFFPQNIELEIKEEPSVSEEQ
jgi:uncharacterized membrane protein